MKDTYIYLVEAQEGFFEAMYKTNINHKVLEFTKKERLTTYGINSYKRLSKRKQIELCIKGHKRNNGVD